MSTILTVPARITVSDLAELIGRDVAEVQEVLAGIGEAGGPDEYLAAVTAEIAASKLGATITVEPRDLVLEVLYEAEITGVARIDDLPPRVARLVSGVLDDKERLDEAIEEASEHWTVSRMPLIDRTILRLGLFELLNDEDTPVAVIVSEAVRLAGVYSTERSGAFVNGVLASLARSVRQD